MRRRDISVALFASAAGAVGKLWSYDARKYTRFVDHPKRKRARPRALTLEVALAFWILTLQASGPSAQMSPTQLPTDHWNDQPSTDTTPTTFSLDAAQYKVPRDYVVWMDNWRGGPQTLVRFKVNFPGFEPLTETTKSCMSVAPAYRPLGCLPVVFYLRRGGGGDLSPDEQFNNARTLFHSQTPLPGPDGFELYETGPVIARINTYRKKSHGRTLFVQCILGDLRAKQMPICHSESRLPNGNVLAYGFNGDQLSNADQIDQGLRTLVRSFTLPEGVSP
jgi:hypothetical protein